MTSSRAIVARGGCEGEWKERKGKESGKGRDGISWGRLALLMRA